MTLSDNSQSILNFQDLHLMKLTEEQIEQIDELLAQLGEQGEIHLIVQRGILKYINKVESRKAWKSNGQE